jgi:hypothetical protein
MKMGRKHSRPPRLLLDTSAIVHQLHGHTLQKAIVREAITGAEVLVPIFVWMEYLRGIILNLIEMWCLLRESVTVEGAFIEWSQKIRQERKLKIILMTVPHWLGGEEIPSRDVKLRRLGDLIVRMVWDFNETYPRPPKDPLACVLGKVDIPRQGYDDDLLLDFYRRFTAVQEGIPNCKLCDFRRAQSLRLRKAEIDLVGPEVRRQYASNAGFVRESEQVEAAANTETRVPSCRWCERLGDTIIALQADRGVTVVTTDHAFVPLGELLGRTVSLLPSLAELKRRAGVQKE